MGTEVIHPRVRTRDELRASARQNRGAPLAAADDEPFLAAMVVQARSRQRTGASEWRVFRSVEHESTFVETFIVRSWGEHMHQHYARLIGREWLIEQAVEKYTDGEPVSEHYLTVREVR